jgi:hypothetical protein
MPKLSQLASILNGEIPVVLVYVENDHPKRYKLAKPEEASAILSIIEMLNAEKKGAEKR